MLITAYQRTAFIKLVALGNRDILELHLEINFFVLGLLPLDAHHLLNCVSDIELFKVLPKFAPFYLGEIQDVLDYKVHELSCVLLDLATVF